MLEKLGAAIKKGIDRIAGAIFVDKRIIDEVVKDLQRALIEFDVNISLVKEISDSIRQVASDEKIKGIEKREQIIKLLHDKLLEILGGEKRELELKKGRLQKVMLLGLYGSGKTTTTAKLANYYNKRGLKTAILGLDIHRPAAREQLEQLGKQYNLNIFIDKQEKDPVKTFKKFKPELEQYDAVIIDTAGRHSLDAELVKEIKTFAKEIKPDYAILVISADIGQAAKTQASEFQKAVGIDGVIITRMDLTARGGGALTACQETKAPVFFITTGEKVNDIETFNPSSFISRILGMGDLEALMEKVKLASEPESLARIQKGKFTMLEFQEQLKSMENVGPLGKIAEMIPGLGSLLGNKTKIPENMIEMQGEKAKKWKYAIDSMTPDEKENPEIIEKETSRLSRIAKGAGINTSDVRALVKQYKIMKEFVKSGTQELSQKQMMKFARKFGKKMRR